MAGRLIPWNSPKVCAHHTRARGLLMRKFYACECDGCCGYRIQFQDMQYQSERAVQSVKGFYLTPNTMKFFGSRVSNFYPLANGGAVFFLTQNSGFENSPRVRSWVVYCPYGNLVQDMPSDDRLIVSAKSLSDLHKLRAVGFFYGVSDSCKCHGCEIDRADLRNIPDAEICIECPTHCVTE